MKNISLGWEEWISIPDLNLPALKVKTDTGAKTSALHAFNIQPFGTKNKPKVRFGINPIEDNDDFTVYCSSDVVDIRDVTSSNGIKELRYVIKSQIMIGDVLKEIELTLSNRSSMSYKMILGRSALNDIVVNPNVSFLQRKLSYNLYKIFSKESFVKKRSLRIAVLTREPNNYSIRKLVHAAEKKDHVVELIDTKKCYLNIQTHQPEVHYDGASLPHYDAIIPRIGPSITFYGMAVVRQFEAMGTFCLNSAQAIGVSRDKLAANQTLARYRIPMPNTAFANSPKDTESLINLASGAPLVLKLLQSSQGKGVILAESKKAASAVISAFQGLDAPFIAQEYIEEAGGSDIRCFVVGKKVIASMKRIAKDGDFRSNLHAGGTSEKVLITKEERKISINATKALGLKIAGVDLIITKDCPKVLEVNSSPGLEGIENTSGVDVSAIIIKFLEDNVMVSNKLKTKFKFEN